MKKALALLIMIILPALITCYYFINSLVISIKEYGIFNIGSFQLLFYLLFFLSIFITIFLSVKNNKKENNFGIKFMNIAGGFFSFVIYSYISFAAYILGLFILKSSIFNFNFKDPVLSLIAISISILPIGIGLSGIIDIVKYIKNKF